MSNPESIGSIMALLVGRLFQDGSFTDCGICAETAALDAGFCNEDFPKTLSTIGKHEGDIPWRSDD